VPIPSYALPHLARVVETTRTGPKDAQGERVADEDAGPWFPARRMSPRSSEGDRENGGRRRSEVRWVLLYGDEYDDGEPLTRPPIESDLVDVDRDGVVERYVVGPRPSPFDTGSDIIGGQVQLVEIGDSA
jgi:hypothetical protein